MFAQFITVAEKYGIAVAVCTGLAALLLWWINRQITRVQDEAREREKYLSARLDSVQEARMKELTESRNKMMEVVANNTQAFTMLEATMRAWHGRPCLFEAAMKAQTLP